jgi:hypothetical protein
MVVFIFYVRPELALINRSTCVASWVLLKTGNYRFVRIGANRQVVAMLDNRSAALSEQRKIWQFEPDGSNGDEAPILGIALSGLANFSFGANLEMVPMSQIEDGALRGTVNCRSLLACHYHDHKVSTILRFWTRRICVGSCLILRTGSIRFQTIPGGLRNHNSRIQFPAQTAGPSELIGPPEHGIGVVDIGSSSRQIYNHNSNLPLSILASNASSGRLLPPVSISAR